MAPAKLKGEPEEMISGDLQVSSSKALPGNGNKKCVEDFGTEKLKGKKRKTEQWEQAESQPVWSPVCQWEKTLSE